MPGQLIPIFSSDERKRFWLEVWDKFRAGVRSPVGVCYLVATIVAVGVASWGIPYFNDSETSPETLGIYVIGLLVSVMFDALVLASRSKENGDGSTPLTAVLAACILTSFVLVFVAGWFSLKIQPERTAWRCGAKAILILILGIAICMSLVLSGVESSVNIPALDDPVAVTDRA